MVTLNPPGKREFANANCYMVPIFVGSSQNHYHFLLFVSLCFFVGTLYDTDTRNHYLEPYFLGGNFPNIKLKANTISPPTTSKSFPNIVMSSTPKKKGCNSYNSGTTHITPYHPISTTPARGKTTVQDGFLGPTFAAFELKAKPSEPPRWELDGGSTPQLDPVLGGSSHLVSS